MKFTNLPHPDLSVIADGEMMRSIIWYLLLLDVPLWFPIYFGSGSNNRISSELTIQLLLSWGAAAELRSSSVRRHPSSLSLSVRACGKKQSGKYISQSSQSLKTVNCSSPCSADELVLTNKKSTAQSITISMRLRNWPVSRGRVSVTLNGFCPRGEILRHINYRHTNHRLWRHSGLQRDSQLHSLSLIVSINTIRKILFAWSIKRCIRTQQTRKCTYTLAVNMRAPSAHSRPCTRMHLLLWSVNRMIFLHTFHTHF